MKLMKFRLDAKTVKAIAALPSATTQQELVARHKTIEDVVQLWASGLITDTEIAAFMARLPVPTGSELSGLLDPNTGLRYPFNDTLSRSE